MFTAVSSVVAILMRNQRCPPSKPSLPRAQKKENRSRTEKKTNKTKGRVSRDYKKDSNGQGPRRPGRMKRVWKRKPRSNCFCSSQSLTFMNCYRTRQQATKAAQPAAAATVRRTMPLRSRDRRRPVLPKMLMVTLASLTVMVIMATTLRVTMIDDADRW